MNFVIEDALEGGVNTALCLDAHGKNAILLAAQHGDRHSLSRS